MKRAVAGMLLAAGLPVWCGCAGAVAPTAEVEASARSETAANRDLKFYETVQYQYRTDISRAVEALLTGMNPRYLLLANREHPLGKAYQPDETVRLTCRTYLNKDILLESRTARALYAMLAEMEADGVNDIQVASGYRTYGYQVSLYHQYLNRECSAITPDAYAYFGEPYIRSVYLEQGKSTLTREDAERVVQSYSAYPGTSEHQTGLSVDFVTSSAMLNRSFENTEAFHWLSENCYRFGFILRYPEDKVSVTGYSYEPWHYRFVGREAATEIMLRGLCLEEFTGGAGQEP